MHGHINVTRESVRALPALQFDDNEKEKKIRNSTNSLSPPCGLLAELAYRCRMNRIPLSYSLMLHYSVLVCLFVSVNFSFNVSGPFHCVDFLITNSYVTLPMTSL